MKKRHLRLSKDIQVYSAITRKINCVIGGVKKTHFYFSVISWLEKVNLFISPLCERGRLLTSFKPLSECILNSGEEKSSWKWKISDAETVCVFYMMKWGDGVTPTKVKVINSTATLWKHIKLSIPFPNIPGPFEHLRIYLFFNSYPIIWIPLTLSLYPYPFIPISLSLSLSQSLYPYPFMPITLSLSLYPYSFIPIPLSLSIYPYPFIPISFFPIPLSLSLYPYPSIYIPLSLSLYPFIPNPLSLSLYPYPFITIPLKLSIYPSLSLSMSLYSKCFIPLYPFPLSQSQYQSHSLLLLYKYCHILWN